jgi:hypothetical protein
MGTPNVVMSAARAIYEYAGTSGLKPWEDLPPTIQISYVEEAEAAISVVASHIIFIAGSIDPQTDEEYLMRGTMLAIAKTLNPKVRTE